MKNLFDAAAAADLKSRIEKVRSDSPREWGKMMPAQALAHLSITMEAAVGDQRPSRMLIGRIVGPLVKRTVVRDDAPMRRNAPTDKRLVSPPPVRRVRAGAPTS